mmetsp:Transcript_96248/g.257333  ORF Transcript_96248/g.257333 Transcript_96248/m.257333 type:complete len:281 (-) Transcript_96248:192-1034(-)
MLTNTNWGELDVLVLDMPPGTGDVHLTVSQSVKVDAAVIVTTANELSLVDVAKGIDMFEKVGIPSACILENMSYFGCRCGIKTPLFTPPEESGAALAHAGGIAYAHLPFEPTLSASTVSGVPFPFVCDPRNRGSMWYWSLLGAADLALREILVTVESREEPAQVVWSARQGKVVVILPSRRLEYHLAPRKLRLACRCAQCVDEFSGRPVLDPASIPQGVSPVVVEETGNYARTVVWTDGHSSIFSLGILLQAAEDFGDCVSSGPGLNVSQPRRRVNIASA